MGDVKSYVASCGICMASKSSTQAPIGLLHPLPVPTDKWDQISMDYVTGLPVTKSKHDAVLVITDRLTKMVILVPTTKDVDAPKSAQLFVKHDDDDDDYMCVHTCCQVSSFGPTGHNTRRGWGSGVINTRAENPAQPM